MNQSDYVHFLTYDQDCMLVNYGLTDLYYKINDNKLFIKKVDQEADNESEFTAILVLPDHKESLKEFLLNFMSNRRNFIGQPLYEKSAIFTKEEFRDLLELAIQNITEQDKRAEEFGLDNEFLQYCRQAGLSPEPAGGNPMNWKANCPSRGGHSIIISLESNTWGCGYCRKKGDLPDLKEWINSRSGTGDNKKDF